jgi:hypothetical protein
MPGVMSALQGLDLVSLNSRRSSAFLTPYDENDVLQSGQAFRFQYFPETIEDSLGGGWESSQIPGASRPIYQWVQGGERTISFTATFSTDTDLSIPADKNQASDINRNYERLKAQGSTDANLDIRGAILILRQFKMPRYGTDAAEGRFTYPPCKLLLTLPNSGLGLYGGGFDADSVNVIMEDCPISFQAFFPSGLPRLVEMALTFKEIAQIAGAISFPHRNAAVVAALADSTPILSYKLGPSR